MPDAQHVARLRVDRRDDAVILAVQLALEGQLHQGALLRQEKRRQGDAGGHDREHDGGDQAG